MYQVPLFIGQARQNLNGTQFAQRALLTNAQRRRTRWRDTVFAITVRSLCSIKALYYAKIIRCVFNRVICY